MPRLVSAQDIGPAPLIETVKKALVLLDKDFDESPVFVIGDAPYAFYVATVKVNLISKVKADGGIDFSVILLVFRTAR